MSMRTLSMRTLSIRFETVSLPFKAYLAFILSTGQGQSRQGRLTVASRSRCL